MTAPTPPKRLWIGQFEFDLTVVPANNKTLAGNDGITVLTSGKREILLSAVLEPRMLFTIAWHEITHAVNFDQDIVDQSTEEQICRSHGEVWTQVLLDNPPFLDWVNKIVTFINTERQNA